MNQLLRKIWIVTAFCLLLAWNAWGAIPNCSAINIHCVGTGQEFTTIQAASNAAVAGDTVLVFDGNYTGFQITNSGTLASPIVFQSNGSNVVINAGGGPQNDGVFIGNKNYITIAGFQIQDVSSRCISARQATATSPMVGLIIKNNVCTNSGKEGFYLSQVSSSLIEGNTITNSGRLGQPLVSHGIYLANSGSKNTVLRDNTISNSGMPGSDAAGMHFNGDISVGGDGIITGLVIEKNVISGGVQNALNMDGVQNSTIQNNLIYGNTRHALRAYKIDGAAGPKNLHIVNNTFLVPRTSSDWAIAFSEDLGGHVILNNILLAEGNGGSIRLENTAVSVSSDRNRVVDKFSVNGGSTILTLAEWTVSGANRDPNSLVSSASALFLNPVANDYHLKTGSPAIDMGVASLASVSAPNSDIADTVRPQNGLFDIGAYEFLPDLDCLFNWAEINYPSLFAPTGATSSTFTPYYYRYYPQTNAYLGTSSSDNHVYYLGPSSNNSLLDVGALSPWLSTAGCQ